MATPSSFAEQLAEAARSMQGWSSTQLTLDEVVRVASEIIHGCDLVGISVVHSDGIDTEAGSDETLNRIDELQFVLREGPCFDALHMHEIVHSDDLATDKRWPRWGPLVAKEVGVVSIVSYRLYTTRDTLVALASAGMPDLERRAVTANTICRGLQSQPRPSEPSGPSRQSTLWESGSRVACAVRPW